MNAASMFHLVFSSNEINSARDIDSSLRTVEREFYLHLLGHDVLVPGIHLAFISWAHTEARGLKKSLTPSNLRLWIYDMMG
ncbi:MAG: hypothetical protein CM1200mP9_09270 [Gammaproteobacteria bacterium]|nr:MAG: hypothetical protein CM1200mP9_09270 [Gammaproteobacteria bacterium]